MRAPDTLSLSDSRVTLLVTSLPLRVNWRLVLGDGDTDRGVYFRWQV